MQIKVSKTATDYGLQLGKKVYTDKLQSEKQSNAKLLQADIYGFIAQSIICEHYGKELPSFEGNKEYDLIINDKRVDVKKVGYNNIDKKIIILVNKNQFERKKDKIDYFMFVTFTGTFQQMIINDYQLFIPMPELSYLNILGYININDIKENSTIYKFYKNNKVYDEAYNIDINKLVDTFK